MAQPIYLCLLAFCSFQLQAGSIGDYDSTPITSDNGLYFAGSIGMGSLFNYESHSFFPENHQLSSLGILGGGFIGYDYSLGRQMSVALELFADATGFNLSISHSPKTYAMNQRYDIGVRLLPEYRINETTVSHVILGYVNGRFAISDNGVYGTILTDFNNSGFQTGLGLSTALTQNILLRFDAIYNLYASEKSKGIYITPPAKQTYTNQFNSLVGDLALIYKF